MTVAARSRAPRTPDGSVILAVGDIHGRLDLLDGVLREVGSSGSSATHDGKQLVTVFLGDYVDRGPAARGVIDRLIELKDSGFCETVFLRGNHEQVLLDLLDGEETTARWIEYGGRETLESYGVEPPPPGRDVAALRQLVRDAIPPEHIAFLRATTLYAIYGDYLFVHAGLRPDRLLEEQSDADMLWFRYYDDQTPVWDHTVVHGHSTNPKPVVGRWRIGIDTEAYASGALTVLRLRDDQQELLKISQPAGGGPAQTSSWETSDVSYQARRRPAAPNRAPPPRPAPAVGAPPRRARAGRRWMFSLVLPVGVIGACAAAVLAIAGATGGKPDAVAPRQAAQANALRIVPARTEVARIAEAAPLTTSPGLRGPAGLPAAAPQPEPAAEPEPAPPAADGPPVYRVQIAAVPTAPDAERLWRDVARDLPDPMRDKTMQVEAAQVGAHSVHRVLVAGFADGKAAGAFCRALTEAGRGCLVRKSPAAQAPAAPPAERKVAVRARAPADES